MKVLTNPLKNKLEIQFNGRAYEIPALSELLATDELAGFWKKTHEFLVVTEPVEVPADGEVAGAEEPIPVADIKTDEDVPDEEDNYDAPPVDLNEEDEE